MVEKTKLMEHLFSKNAYSRPVAKDLKRQLINQKKINDYLGRNLVDRDAEDDQGDVDAESFLTTPTEKLHELIGTKDITYKVLLDALAVAEGNYEHMRSQSDGKAPVINQLITQATGQSNSHLSQGSGHNWILWVDTNSEAALLHILMNDEPHMTIWTHR